MTPRALASARAVCFDLDNTLVDRDAAFVRWVDGMVPPEAVPGLAALDAGGHGPREAVFDAVAALSGLPVATVRHAFFSGIGDACRVRPDADAVLTHLRGRVPVVVVTNGHSAVQRSKVAGAGLGGRVDHVVVSTEVGHHKPAPDPFLAALAWLGMPPDDVWMVGDNPVNDVDGAVALGMGAVFVRTPHFAHADRAHLSTDDLRTLPWP